MHTAPLRGRKLRKGFSMSKAELIAHFNLIADQVLKKCKGDHPPPCEAVCPLHLQVREYVQFIAKGRYSDALKVVKQQLPFPGIIGRICTRPCEPACRRGEIESPVAICDLKRFLADYIAEDEAPVTIAVEKRQSVAVVGAGPAGLMAAHDLRMRGYSVTIFDGLAELGGMLYSSIPEYRLPHAILRKELSLIYRLGITVHLQTYVGRQISFNQIRKDFSAVFLALGKPLGKKLAIPGEELHGVYLGLDLLQRLKRGETIPLGSNVVVIGGGNVAMDAARSAWRSGATTITVLYRRSRDEMPAIPGEIEEAEREGIRIHYLAAPERIMERDGCVCGVAYTEVKLGSPDDRGRRQPMLVPGSGSSLAADSVIIAAGQALDTTLVSAEFGLKLGPDQELRVNPDTLATEIENIFVGGDMLSDEGTAIAALAAGRKAALFIDRYLSGETDTVHADENRGYDTPFLQQIHGIPQQERIVISTRPIEERQGNFEEAITGWGSAEAIQEAGRCLDCRCNSCVKDCEFLKMHGFPKSIAQRFHDRLGEVSRTAYSCNICGLCATVCPEGLDMGKLCMALREELVGKGEGPLPEHQAVKNMQEYVLSDSFRLVQPDPRTGGCKRVFFPGCSLSGYAPDLVMKSYQYLLNHLPDTGIILGCCGGPTHFLGEQAAFRQIVKDIEDDMGRLGASEIIVACPDCSRTLKENFPRLQVKSIYEVMVEQGLPDGVPTGGQWTFSLHDSCTARYQPDLRDSVRYLIRQMEYEIEEVEYSGEKARCCGMGGMVPFVDFALAGEITKRRADEFNHDIISYCAGCREALAMNKASLHILDLVFNQNWKETRHQATKTGKKRREAQSETRALLVKLVQNGEAGKTPSIKP